MKLAPKQQTHNISLWIPADCWEALKALAAEQGTTVSGLMRQAVAERYDMPELMGVRRPGKPAAE